MTASIPLPRRAFGHSRRLLASPRCTLHPVSSPFRIWQSHVLGRCWSSSDSAPTNIASLLESSSHNTQLTLKGFVRSVRKQKRIAFAAVGDGSSLQTVQAVLTPEQAEGLSTGAAVAITGQWKASLGHGQSYELQAESVRILGENDAATNPVQKKYQTAEFLRTLPHLRTRLPFNSLLLRLRSQVTAQITDYFSKHAFVQTHPPIITSSDCEGAGEVFTVSTGTNSIGGKPRRQSEDAKPGFFQSPKYLTVSSQLHLEALAQSVGRVWTLSPTFRAEKSDTARHLSEFYMLEAEIAFVDDMSDVMDVVESMLRAVAQQLQSSRIGQELLEYRKREIDGEGDESSITDSVLASRWQGLVEGPWLRITFDEAVQHLQDAVTHHEIAFEFMPNSETGLQTEHERYLADTLGRGGPVFVTDYPRGIKPFYMAPSVETSTRLQSTQTVACFDLLVPEICELVGGSLREHRLTELLKSMDDHGLCQSVSSDPSGQTTDASLQWYLDLRRYGSVPHGGFGLGFDRLLCYLAGVSNIRDVVSFPRWYGRCDC